MWTLELHESQHIFLWFFAIVFVQTPHCVFCVKGAVCTFLHLRQVTGIFSFMILLKDLTSIWLHLMCTKHLHDWHEILLWFFAIVFAHIIHWGLDGVSICGIVIFWFSALNFVSDKFWKGRLFVWHLRQVCGVLSSWILLYALTSILVQLIWTCWLQIWHKMFLWFFAIVFLQMPQVILASCDWEPSELLIFECLCSNMSVNFLCWTKRKEKAGGQIVPGNWVKLECYCE